MLQLLTVDNSFRLMLLFYKESHIFAVRKILKFPLLHG